MKKYFFRPYGGEKVIFGIGSYENLDHPLRWSLETEQKRCNKSFICSDFYIRNC